MENVSRKYTHESIAAAVLKGNNQDSGQFDVSAGQKSISAYAVWLFEQDFW